MALDLTWGIKKIINPYWLNSVDGKKYQIRPLDDLDKCYIIRAKEGEAYWLNYFANTKVIIEEITSPEKGIIEVKVMKIAPKYPTDYLDDYEQFLKDVADYFTDVFGGQSIFGDAFRMKEYPICDTVDTSYMKYSNEGDELGWVQQESEVCVGLSYVLDGPTIGENKGYTTFSEEMIDFILRKLEDIFGTKGAWYDKEPDENSPAFCDKFYHYKFHIFLD